MAKKSGKRATVVAASAVAVLLSGCINFETGVTAQASADAAAWSTDVAFADVTGDGVADPLVLTSQGRVQRLAPCGAGCFARAEAVGAGVRSLEVGDLDADGVSDVVVGTTTGVVAYFGGAAAAGRPAGLVESDRITIDATTLDASVVTGDFDGDGTVDIGAFGTLDDPDFPAPRYVEAAGNGTGGFAPPVERFQALGSGLSVGLRDTGDVDGDGDDEVVFVIGVAQLGDMYVSVYGDDADDHFAVDAPDIVDDVAVGDLYGDGKVDLVAKRFSRSDIPTYPVIYYVLRSTGTAFTGFGAGGTVTTLAAEPPTFEAPDLEIADLDGDGRADVVTTDPARNRISWWHGTGDGSFTTYGSSQRVDRAAGPGASEIAVEEGAARPDLLVTNRSASNAQITYLANASAGS